MRRTYFLLILFCAGILLHGCGKKEDACDSVICLNGGSCDNGNCDCPAGFVGDICENQICGTAFCQHDGVCNNGTCDCPEGYLGDFCEVVTPCAALNCPDNAFCQTQDDGSLACVCNTYYQGSGCEEARKSYYYSNYVASESCTPGVFTNFASISSSFMGVEYFNIVGPAAAGSGNYSMSAMLLASDGNKFNIPEQLLGTNLMVVGTTPGTRDPSSGTITVSYSVTNLSTTQVQNCTLTLTK